MVIEIEGQFIRMKNKREHNGSSQAKPLWRAQMKIAILRLIINWIVIYFAWQNDAKNKCWRAVMQCGDE